MNISIAAAAHPHLARGGWVFLGFGLAFSIFGGLGRWAAVVSARKHPGHPGNTRMLYIFWTWIIGGPILLITGIVSLALA